MSSDRIQDTWLLTAKVVHKGLFSELDVLLRALDRFFSLDNLPISKENLTDRDFHNELAIVRDVIFRILAIFEVIMPESRKNAYWFQKFAESKFLNDHSRDIFRNALYRQDTPEKSMLLMYDLFINLKSLVTDLLKTGTISFLSYKNIGQLIAKEIRENAYLNPFQKDVNRNFDIIENPQISEIVKSIKDRKLKKNISLLFIYFFRCLRFISHIDLASQHTIALHSSLLILILLRSEMSLIHAYIKDSINRIKEPELMMILQSIAYQISMEMKRVYLQELKEILQNKSPNHLRGKIENSHGIAKNLIEQSIVQIAQYFRPAINGEDIFESFTTRLHYSMKLREDLFILHRFLALLEENASLQEKGTDIFESMKNFMRYFESFTFKLLRFDDYDEFASFFNSIFSSNNDGYNRLLEKIHSFNIFLETTLRHISNRSELKDKPLDIIKAEELLQQYLKPAGDRIEK